MFATAIAGLLSLGMMTAATGAALTATEVANKCWQKGRNAGIIDGINCIERIHGRVLKGKVLNSVMIMMKGVR